MGLSGSRLERFGLRVRIKPTAVHQAVYSSYSRPIRSTTRISSSQNTTVHVHHFFAGSGTHVSPRGGGGRQISICSRDLSKISHIFKALLTMGPSCTLKEAKESKTLGTLSHVGFLFEGHPRMFFLQNTHKCFIPFYYFF